MVRPQARMGDDRGEAVCVGHVVGAIRPDMTQQEGNKRALAGCIKSKCRAYSKANCFGDNPSTEGSLCAASKVANKAVPGASGAAEAASNWARITSRCVIAG